VIKTDTYIHTYMDLFFVKNVTNAEFVSFFEK